MDFQWLCVYSGLDEMYVLLYHIILLLYYYYYCIYIALLSKRLYIASHSPIHSCTHSRTDGCVSTKETGAEVSCSGTPRHLARWSPEIEPAARPTSLATGVCVCVCVCVFTSFSSLDICFLASDWALKCSLISLKLHLLRSEIFDFSSGVIS